MHSSFPMLAPVSGLTSGGPSMLYGKQAKMVSGPSPQTSPLQPDKLQDSKTPTTVTYPVDETQSLSSKASSQSKSNGPDLGKSAKGVSTRDMVRKLKQLALVANDTVVLRNRQGRRRGSLHDLVRVRSAPSSVVESAPSSSKITIEKSVAGEVLVEPHYSTANGTSRRPDDRWNHSGVKPTPRFPLCTIKGSSLDQFQPTILTVEKAAAAKIYLETHFNEKLHLHDSKGTRRQYLETQLYYSPHLTEYQKAAVRGSFWSQETHHLRETRVLRSKSLAAGQGLGTSPVIDNYKPLKVLGKGSFGVVRLVQERSHSVQVRPKQMFAMKVIRKSAMLRSSQEGHLRAERDFLVASEGANWYVCFPSHRML